MACVIGKLVRCRPFKFAGVDIQEGRASATDLTRSHLLGTGADDRIFHLTDEERKQLKWLDPFSGSAQRAEGVSFELTETNRRLLEKLLPKLPKLVMPVSESDRAKFVEDFRELARDVDWVPDVLTEQVIVRQRQLQAEYFERTMATLVEKVARGQLMACDELHIPIMCLGLGSMISRSAAIDYLEQLGLPYDDDGRNLGAVKRKLRIADKRKLYDYCLSLFLKKRGNYNQLTAVKFGISGRQVRNIINEIDAARGAMLST